MANNLIDGASDAFDELTGNITRTAETYLSLEKIIPNVIDLLSDQAGEIRKLNRELGNGSNFAADFRKEIDKVSANIGISSRKTLDLVNATKEYHQGITASTESTLKFQKASGVSIDIIGKMTAKINVLGNVSSKTYDAMYENILAVRDAYGLTSSQMDDVIGLLSDYAVVMQASDSQMERATTVMSKFTSALTSVGIASERVKEILNNMVDPDRLNDNLVLMNKMGITVNDMISGDPMTKLEGSIDNLKQLGQEISEIAKSNRLQANEMAKVYGLTLQEAIMLSELDTSEKALNTQKKLDEYRNEMATMVESLNSFKQAVIGNIAGIINPIMKGFESLEGKLGLFSKGLVTIGTMLVGKFILGKLKDGIMSIFGQAAKKFGETVSGYLIQVENRSRMKTTDAAKLTPKAADMLDQKYGFGYDFAIRAQRRNEAASQRFIKPEQKMTAGEIIEMNSSLVNRLFALEEEGKKLTGSRLRAFENKYGGVENMRAARQNLTSSGIFTGSSFDESLTGEIGKFSRNKGAVKNKAAESIIDKLSSNERFSFLGDFAKTQEDKNAVAEVIAGSNGYREALVNLETFFREKGLIDQIEKTTEALGAFDEEIVNSYTRNTEAKRAIKEANMTLDGNGIGANPLGNRFRAIGRGITENISAFAKDLSGNLKKAFHGVFNFLKPSNLLGILGKGLKIGGIGLLAGAGAKFMSSLSKNEKFQETMTTITETIGKVFDDIVKSMEPVIETMANVVTAIFNVLQTPINWIVKAIGGISRLIGGVLNKTVSNISDNVATISDTYKQEDLRTMQLAVGGYNSTNDAILSKLDGISYMIEGVHKRQDENTQVNYMQAIRNQ